MSSERLFLKDLVFIVGYTASGKSFISNEYAKNGYFVISTDEVIRENLMKNSKNVGHFMLYNRERMHLVPDSKNKFMKILHTLIRKHKKVAIEGQLNHILIREIIEENNIPDYDVVLVQPQSKKVWEQHIRARFVSDPMTYGKIGWLDRADEDNGRTGFQDFLANGIDGKVITKLIRDGVESKYNKQIEFGEYYKEHYEKIGKLVIFVSL